MGLSKEQLLLLNDLVYKDTISKYGHDGTETIGDVAQAVLHKNLSDQDRKVVEAILNDPSLKNIEIVSTYANEDKGQSALLRDPVTNEAIVLFQGTGSDEWKDNFTAGADVSSKDQQDALSWYQSLDLDSYSAVTVTGHSKGGNKAKYVTVMDNSVDRCVSFDGQGFSDEFIEANGDAIARNQGKIENHNKNYDYVNLLMNDIGTTTFYEGCELNNVIENHYASSMLEFDADGSCHMTAVDRPKEMAALDEFLNGYLRSLSPEDKAKILGIIGDIANEASWYGDLADDQKSWQFLTEELLRIATYGNNEDSFANLLAYLIEYQRQNPEFASQIQSVMDRFGMSEVSQWITTIENVMNEWWFDLAFSATGVILKNLPSWLVDIIKKKIKELTGLDLTDEELQDLLNLIYNVSKQRETIKLYEDGKDMVVQSELPTESSYILVKGAALAAGIDEINGIADRLSECSDRLSAISFDGILGKVTIQPKLKKQRERIEKWEDVTRKMASVLSDIRTQYETTEARCAEVG